MTVWDYSYTVFLLGNTVKDSNNNKALDWVGGVKSAAEIRQALIQIAERKGRPHYTLNVAREVIHAIKNNLDHHLKAEVEAEKVLLVHSYEHKNNRLDTLIEFSNRIGMKRILADVSGVSHSNVSNITRGNTELTNSLWVRLLDSFDEAERIWKARNKSKVGARDWSK